MSLYAALSTVMALGAMLVVGWMSHLPLASKLSNAAKSRLVAQTS